MRPSFSPTRQILALVVMLLLVGVQAGLAFHASHHHTCAFDPSGNTAGCALCQAHFQGVGTAPSVFSLEPSVTVAALVVPESCHRVSADLATQKARSPPVRVLIAT